METNFRKTIFALGLLLALFIVLIAGCLPSYVRVSPPVVYVKEGFPSSIGSSRLIVLPFDSPSYYPEIGFSAGNLFYRSLLKKGTFGEVFFYQDPEWHERGRTWSGKTELAIEMARRTGYQFVLVGEVESYRWGKVASPHVALTVRLIDAETAQTLRFVGGTGRGKPGNTYLLFNTERPEESPSTSKVFAAVIEDLVSRFF